jgi:hypothetical protein
VPFACAFCFLFSPSKFIDAEQLDINARNNYKGGEAAPHRAFIVRRAFFTSLLLVLLSAAIGWGAANVVTALGRCSTPQTVVWLQVVGAGLLLWGTLFVRGWEIQTYSGVVFTERVNQWLYRFLYCTGTSVIVYSLAFLPCRA